MIHISWSARIGSYHFIAMLRCNFVPTELVMKPQDFDAEFNEAYIKANFNMEPLYNSWAPHVVQ